MTREEFQEFEAAATRSYGHCNEMGTASSMACVVEALGMCMPGTATIPAVDAARLRAAEATGRRAVELAREELAPVRILTSQAFDNAITVLTAIGGSTNVVLHLLAFAGRVGVPLTLTRFGEISQRTPLLVNVRPSGEHLVGDLHEAGGVPAVLKEREPLLYGDAVAITGRVLRENVASSRGTRPQRDCALDRALGSPGRSCRAPWQSRPTGCDHQAERCLTRAAPPSRTRPRL